MKKINSKYKSSLVRKSRRVKLIKRKDKRKFLALKRNTMKKLRIAKKLSQVKIFAPESFQLSYKIDDSHRAETRHKLINFINKIYAALEKGKKAHISFKNTNSLAPSGTLVFVAEFEKLLRKYPNKVTIDYPKDDVVEQLFQHIGLLEKMGLPHRKEITAENVRPWNYAKGNNVDTTQFKSLFARYSSEMSEDVSSGLFDSMSEAVTNSFQHSCGHQNTCSCEKNWWMFARQESNTLEVVMYDAGIGIPTSLRNKPELKEWLMTPYRKVKKNLDTMMIDIAIQSLRTSTKLPHRGKGLKDMLQFVKEGNVGGFLIFSGLGAFSYSAKNQIESGKDFKVPVKGTLIQWHIPLNNSK